MTEKRKFYLFRRSPIFSSCALATDHAKAVNMGFYVLRGSEGEWRAIELCLTPLREMELSFEVNEQERSRLEAEITAAKTKAAKPAPTERQYYLVRVCPPRDGTEAAELDASRHDGPSVTIFDGDDNAYSVHHLALEPVQPGQAPFHLTPKEKARLDNMAWPTRHATPEKAPVDTIDLTPTWQAFFPWLVEGLSDRATPEGNRIAKAELSRMAQAADAWNAHCKGVK